MLLSWRRKHKWVSHWRESGQSHSDTHTQSRQHQHGNENTNTQAKRGTNGESKGRTRDQTEEVRWKCRVLRQYFLRLVRVTKAEARGGGGFWNRQESAQHATARDKPGQLWDLRDFLQRCGPCVSRRDAILLRHRCSCDAHLDPVWCCPVEWRVVLTLARRCRLGRKRDWGGQCRLQCSHEDAAPGSVATVKRGVASYMKSS